MAFKQLFCALVLPTFLLSTTVTLPALKATNNTQNNQETTDQPNTHLSDVDDFDLENFNLTLDEMHELDEQHANMSKQEKGNTDWEQKIAMLRTTAMIAKQSMTEELRKDADSWVKVAVLLSAGAGIYGLYRIGLSHATKNKTP